MKRIAISFSRRPPWIIFILGLASLIYASSFNYYYFGRYNDDARHFLAARSLLQGRYVNLAHPKDPPLLNQLPGYPLLLTPAAALHSPRFAQWMNVGFLLGSLYLLLRLFGKTAPGLAAVGLTALHPLTVIQAGSIMTEASYFFFTIASLYSLVFLLDHPKELRAMAVLRLAALCAWCGWIHPQGATLLLSISLLLLENRSARKWGWLFIVIGGFLFALPFLRNLWISGTPATYFGELPSANQGLLNQISALGENIWANLCRYANLLTNEGMLSWTDPLIGAGSLFAKFSGFGVLLIVGLGLRNVIKAGNIGRAVGTYVICYVGFHLFWVNQFFRYVFPVLPFLYWFFFSAPWMLSHPRSATVGFSLLALLFVGLDATVVVNSHLPRIGENVLPIKTIKWINENTPQDTILASGFDSTLHYYTNRKYIQPISLLDPDEWFHQLLIQDARFYVDYKDLEAMPSVPSRENLIARALRLAESQLKISAWFQPLYQPTDEPFGVYAISRPNRFEEGYRLLQEAKEAIGQGQMDIAYLRLKQVEETRAPLVRLPFYLGTTAMLRGKKAEARKYLNLALRLEPEFTPTQRNLERLDAMQ